MRRMFSAVLLICIGAAALGWGIRGLSINPTDPQARDIQNIQFIEAMFVSVGMLGAAIGTLFGKTLDSTFRYATVALLLAAIIFFGGGFIWHFFLQAD
jgi:hypothetical protein